MNIPNHVNEVREKLNERKGEFMKISLATGIPYFWTLRFARGTSKSPNFHYVTILDDYFKQQDEQERRACMKQNTI